MKYLVTDCRGARLDGNPFSDSKTARAAGREHLRAGKGPVMIFLADDRGQMLAYSSKDTAAVHKNPPMPAKSFNPPAKA